MTENAEVLKGVHLSSLHAGSVIDLETKSRHYRIEYLGGDEARISDHPELCPYPVLVHLQGSIGPSVEAGFIGEGMSLVYSRVDDPRLVTTSKVKGIHVLEEG